MLYSFCNIADNENNSLFIKVLRMMRRAARCSQSRAASHIQRWAIAAACREAECRGEPCCKARYRWIGGLLTSVSIGIFAF